MPDDPDLGADDLDHDTDAIAARLMGSTLTGVRYFDTPLFTDQIDEERPAAGPHAPGHGVDLCLDDRVVGDPRRCAAAALHRVPRSASAGGPTRG